MSWSTRRVGAKYWGVTLSMTIGTGRTELELWQVSLMVIGAGAIFLLTVLIMRNLVRRGRVGQDASDAKKFETRRRGARIGTSCWVASVVMILAVQRDLTETAVPWHELLMVIGVGAVAFTATELMWAVGFVLHLSHYLVT